MEDVNKQMDNLFVKARNAKVDYSVEKVAAAVGVASMVTAAIAIGTKTAIKLSTLSIMIGSAITVATTLVVLNLGTEDAVAGNNNLQETTTQSLMVDEPKQKAEPTREIEFIPLEIEHLEEEESEKIVVEDEFEPIELLTIEEPTPESEMIEPVQISEITRKKGVVDYGEAIHSVYLQLPITIELVANASGTTEVMGGSELEELLQVHVENGILYIDADRKNEKIINRKYKHLSVHVKVGMSEIRELVVNGSGDILSDESIQSTKLDVVVNGSGDVSLSKVAPEEHYSVTINGSGDVSLHGKGKLSTGIIVVNGSGDACTKSLNADKIDISINGSGDITTACEKELNISILGSGDVCYSGSPAVNLSKTGSGDVRNINGNCR